MLTAIKIIQHIVPENADFLLQIQKTWKRVQILSYFLQMTTISVSSREIWEIIKIDCTCFQILDADIMISKEHPVRPLKKVRGLRLMLCGNALCKKYL